MGNIYGDGIDQGDLYTFLSTLETNWNALLAKLDADDLQLSTYVSLYAVDLNDKASGTGLGQDDIVSFLDDFIAKFNACMTALDGDTTVNTTTYNSGCAVTDVVNSLTSGKINSNGLNQGNLVHLLQAVITGLAACTALLDADSGVAAEDYASTCDISDTIDTTGCNASDVPA